MNHAKRLSPFKVAGLPVGCVVFAEDISSSPRIKNCYSLHMVMPAEGQGAWSGNGQVSPVNQWLLGNQVVFM